MTKYLKGLSQVLMNLNKEVQGIENRSLKGLIRAGIIVRRSMDKVSPTVPVDTGNLRSSYFAITSDGVVRAGKAPKFGGEKPWTAAKAHKKAVSSISNVSGPSGPFIQLGFTAAYAVYVHEMLGRSGRAKRGLRFSRPGIGSIGWNRPGSGPKFLENALDRNIPEIIYTVAKEARVK